MRFFHLLIFLFLLLIQKSSSQQCDRGAGPVDCELHCQFEDDGTFYNNANKCEDELPDCELIFSCPAETPTCVDPWTYAGFIEGDPTTYPKVRSTFCDIPSLQNVARKCAKTCKLCCEKPEFMCYNNEDWTDWCVEHQSEYCHNESWRPLMAELCGQTCGLCLERKCIDKLHNCETMWALCNHVDHMDFMRDNCAATCEYCTAAEKEVDVDDSCADIGSICEKIPHLCNHDIYSEVMKVHCKKTCNLCSVTNSTDCYDATPSCIRWTKNGFCENEFYNDAQKKTYCAKTCKLC